MSDLIEKVLRQNDIIENGKSTTNLKTTVEDAPVVSIIPNSKILILTASSSWNRKHRQEGVKALHRVRGVANRFKKSFAPLAMMFALLLFFAACKEENTMLPEGTFPMAPSGVELYEVYGEMYVGIAEYYLQNSKYRGLNLDTVQSEYKHLRLQYLLAENPFAIDASEKVAFYTSMNDIDCAKEFAGTMMFNHTYVNDAINLLLTSGIVNDTTVGKRNFLNGVHLIELQVLDDESLSTGVKDKILISTARLRHLAPFIIEQMRNPNSDLNVIKKEIEDENDGEEYDPPPPATWKAHYDFWYYQALGMGYGHHSAHLIACASVGSGWMIIPAGIF